MEGTSIKDKIEAVLEGKANGIKINGLCKLHKVAGSLLLEFEQINDLPYTSAMITLHSSDYQGVREEIKNEIAKYLQDVTNKVLNDL